MSEHKDQNHPDDARVLEGARAWCEDVMGYAPLDVDALVAKARRAPAAKPGRWVWRVSVPMAAAAVLLLAFSQVRFTVSFGDTTFVWGRTAVESLEDTPLDASSEVVEALAVMAGRLNALEAAALEQNSQLARLAQYVARSERDWQRVANGLAQRQNMETFTRYRDVEKLIRLASGDSNP